MRTSWFRPAWSWASWLALAGVCLVLGLLLSQPRLLSRLPPEAERLRPLLAQGILVVLVGLGVAAVLAVLCAFWWPKADEQGASISLPRTRIDLAVSLALLAGSALLLVPHLGDSFWWDELSTLVIVVRRGPVVIFTYSNYANNHVLNSLLMWLVRAVAGEGEVQMHLPAFFLGLVTPLAAYWTLRGMGGRGLAALTAAGLAVHIQVIAHASEARGYAGAILCSLLACSFFARMLRGRAGNREAILYVLSATAAMGFLVTSVLVPVAQGVAALALYLHSVLARTGAESEVRYRRALLACLWTGALAAILFGLPAPQTLAYASDGGQHDHRAMSVALLWTCADYVAGGSFVAISLGLLALAGAGWFFLRRDLPLCLAFLPPAVLELAYLALPNAHASPRLLYLLIPPFTVGLAGFLYHLASRKRVGTAVAAAVLLAWLASAAPLHWRFWTIGKPNLKGLGARARTEQIVLVGEQADVNTYYFPHARVIRGAADQDFDPENYRDADLIVNGVSAGRTGVPRFATIGYELRERLDSWVEGGNVFEVYSKRPSAEPLGRNGSGRDEGAGRSQGIGE